MAARRTCVRIWSYIDDNNENNDEAAGKWTSRPEHFHLLWMLFYLKTGSTEDVACSYWGVDGNTYRKWVWLLIEKISYVNSIVSTNNTHHQMGEQVN